MKWQFRGSPYFLDRQSERFKVPQHQAHVSRNDQGIYKIQTLVSQLCERHQRHRSRREDGQPIFAGTDLAAVKGVFEECEKLRSRFYLLAGAADAMLSEAYSAFEIAPPRRSYEIFCDNDPPQIFPLGDGTVGAPDEPEPALPEGG